MIFLLFVRLMLISFGAVSSRFDDQMMKGRQINVEIEKNTETKNAEFSAPRI
jgi:hypothetical protein